MELVSDQEILNIAEGLGACYRSWKPSRFELSKEQKEKLSKVQPKTQTA